MKQQLYLVNIAIVRIVVLTIFFGEFIVLGLISSAIYDSLSRGDLTGVVTLLTPSIFFLISPILTLPLFSPILFITAYIIFLLYCGLNRLIKMPIVDLSSIAKILEKYSSRKSRIIYKYLLFFPLAIFSASIYYVIVVNLFDLVFNKLLLHRSDGLEYSYAPHILVMLGSIGYIVFIVISLVTKFLFKVDYFLVFFLWLVNFRSTYTKK